MSSVDQAISPNGSSGPSSKRNKPCQQCQKLKVKCERNRTGGGPCLRCASQNKECTYHELPNKKRKKDPDEYPFCRRAESVDGSMSWRRPWRLCEKVWGSIIHLHLLRYRVRILIPVLWGVLDIRWICLPGRRPIHILLLKDGL